MNPFSTLILTISLLIISGCSGMPMVGKNNYPIPKSQILAEQEFASQKSKSNSSSISSKIKEESNRSIRLASMSASLKQTIADTLGIGGIMRALRTIPVLLDIAKDVMEICPKAIWLQYVNPMCANMIAINKSFPGIKTLGLCHSVQGTAEMLAKDLGENIEDIDYLCAGINHMAFYQKFEKKANGKPAEDLYPRLKDIADKIVNDEMVSSRSKKEADYSGKVLHEKVRYEILRRFGYFVTESSEHFAEYVPWFIKQNRKDVINKYKIPIEEYIDRCERNVKLWDQLENDMSPIYNEPLKRIGLHQA